MAPAAGLLPPAWETWIVPASWLCSPAEHLGNEPVDENSLSPLSASQKKRKKKKRQRDKNKK